MALAWGTPLLSTLVYLFLESKAREPIGGLPCMCMEIRNDKWYVKIYLNSDKATVA